jgi:brefeldin A-inhibited guanine nucleotide-exchange protein
MEVVLLDGFKKIRKASSRKHKELRTACDAATDELQKAKYLGFSAERYWEVFELALNAGSNDVTEAALEALFRLIQDGHVRPTATVERGGKVVELSAVMLDIICEAKLGTDAARAWSAKALLACVTAPEVTTHGDALIRAVRVLRASALESKAAAPKATARGALQDIISSTFARMEAAEVKRRETAASSPTAAAAASSSTTASVSPAASPPGSPTTVSNMYPMSSAVAAVQPPPLPPAGPPPPLVAMYPEVFLFLCYDLQHAKRSSASSSRSSASAAAAAAASTAASLTAAAEASSPGGATSGNNSSGAAAANSSSSGNSSSSAAVESRSSSSGSVRQGGHRFPAVQHRDAWLCLRELCTATEDMATTLLRLELILGLLEKSGPAFRGGEPFVECVRTSLCAELLKNCTSNVMPVVSLSLRIFVALTHNFKDHLKSEVEVFVTRIFLRILESENRSHEQKVSCFISYHSALHVVYVRMLRVCAYV